MDLWAVGRREKLVEQRGGPWVAREHGQMAAGLLTGPSGRVLGVRCPWYRESRAGRPGGFGHSERPSGTSARARSGADSSVSTCPRKSLGNP